MIVEPDFFDHWKTRLLIAKTRDEAAPLMILRLWGHCQQRKKWRFDTTPDAIAAICHCRNIDPYDLLTILIECKFLANDGGTFVVHDWEKANRSLISAWKNGSKGGRKVKSLENRQVGGGIPVGNRPPTHPSNLSSLSNQSVKKGETEGDDLAWLAGLRDDPAYKGIDVAREHAKATRWCKENKRQITRRFFINWLNKCDKVLEVKFKPAAKTVKVERPEGNDFTPEKIEENKKFFADLVGQIAKPM